MIPMTYQEAAKSALAVQDGCNLSGICKSLAGEVMDALWTRARVENFGTRWINTHPIVTMYLLKMAELNGCDSTLNSAYENAQKLCYMIAAGNEDAY